MEITEEIQGEVRKIYKRTISTKSFDFVFYYVQLYVILYPIGTMFESQDSLVPYYNRNKKS